MTESNERWNEDFGDLEKMTQWSLEIKRGEAFTLKEGDLLIFQAKQPLAREELTNLAEKLNSVFDGKQFPNVHILLLDKEFAVYHVKREGAKEFKEVNNVVG